MEFRNSPPRNYKGPQIKIFQMSQKYFTILGISPALITQTFPFNWEISIGFALSGIVLVLNLLFIFYEAISFFEFCQSIYVTCGLILGSVAMASIISRVEILYKFIENIENTINTSE